jgi:hypothetical protein
MMMWLGGIADWIAEHATVISAIISAIATGFVALFTIKLTAATAGLRNAADQQQRDTRDALKLTRDSLGLARDEFNATHRPELIAREVFWGPRNEEIRYTLVNKGRNSCTIIESAFELRGSESGQALRTEGNNEIAEAHRILAPGQFHDIAYTIDTEEEGLTAGFMTAASQRSGYLSECFFRGTILYEDATGVRRRYAFTRRCEGRSQTFLPTGKPEDEWND